VIGEVLAVEPHHTARTAGYGGRLELMLQSGDRSIITVAGGPDVEEEELET
jgi:hypothetical protein